MSSKADHLHRLWLVVAIFLLSLMGAACGRSQSGGASSGVAAAPTAPPLPVPTKNFVAVGQLTVLTDTATLTETTQTTQTASSGVDLKRGETAYTKNKCGDCHGAKGEGVADKGGPVAGTTLAFAEFDKVLRTGGGLGNTHIFGRSAVSPSGMEALYAYVQSLGQ